jgi:hypothetical protein
MNVQSYKVNPEQMFFLNSTELAAVNQFLSPTDEASFVKDCPLDRLEEIRSIVRRVANGRTIRTKYRGPRYDSMRLTCLKKNARSFAIYID